MNAKRTLENEINAFLQDWDFNELVVFIEDVLPLFELYNVDENEDWVKDETNGDCEHVITIRLIRTVYLMSKIASKHAGRLCTLNAKYRDLWKKMEKQKESAIHLTVVDAE